jgi:hypothetical protein
MAMLGILLMTNKLRKKRHGQGVIEYAGALILATVLVSGAIAIASPGFSSMFSNVLTQASTMLVNHINGLNGS